MGRGHAQRKKYMSSDRWKDKDGFMSHTYHTPAFSASSEVTMGARKL